MEKVLALSAAVFLISLSAHATTEQNFREMESERNAAALAAPGKKLPPAERFQRAQAVLSHFGVPDEEESQPFVDDLQGVTSEKTVLQLLKSLDRTGQFAAYSTVMTTATGGRELQVFQDDEAKTSLDYRVRLADSDQNVSPLRDRLLRAAQNSAALPLAGLRIALDPGHMGGDPWDERTGKFVRDKKGRQLSEGLLVLQTSLLLEEKLKALGAQVLLTRRSLAPVTGLDYDTFNLRPMALQTLRENSSLDWFQALLATAPAGNALYNAFSSNADFKRIFSESSRSRLFILGEDLDARVEAIRAFSADLTLIIHMDTSDPPGDPTGINPKGYDGTKAYVPGGFFENEFASRTDRKFFGRHLLDTRAWDASVQLSRAVVREIQSRMGIRPDPSDGGNSVRVETGVLARNLRVQRQLTGQATSYVETLFYNDPAEFAALLDARHPLQIDGRNYPYSDRLALLADSLAEAVRAFVKNYR